LAVTFRSGPLGFGQPAEALRALLVIEYVIEHQTQIFFRPDVAPVLVEFSCAALQLPLRVIFPIEISSKLAHAKVGTVIALAAFRPSFDFGSVFLDRLAGFPAKFGQMNFGSDSPDA
jgi:hypothetical protein